MPTNNRTEIFRFAVDAAGDPDIIQLQEGVGPFRKITASIEGGNVEWTLFAPLATSISKTFSIGQEYVFQSGRYEGNDVLGYVEIASGSDYLILFCER